MVSVVVAVLDVVGDVVNVVVVVGDDVMLVVALVVGVVTWHPWNPPPFQAAYIAFIVSTVASQSVPSYKRKLPKNEQDTSSSSPAGPRNSRRTELIADTVPD